VLFRSIWLLAVSILSLIPIFLFYRVFGVLTSSPDTAGEIAPGILPLTIWTVMVSLVIAGSICMLLLRGRRAARTAAICAVIPFFSPLVALGIPFGIWALVLLARPEVKGRFGQNPLLGPAIWLFVLAILSMGVSISSTQRTIGTTDTSTPFGAGVAQGAMLLSVVEVASMLTIIAGSICMLRSRVYWGAVTATVVAMIPFLSPLLVLGIPFGIWALVLLARPEVKECFSVTSSS